MFLERSTFFERKKKTELIETTRMIKLWMVYTEFIEIARFLIRADLDMS